jgi:hypothetical protein
MSMFLIQGDQSLVMLGFECEGVCLSLLEEDDCFKDLDFPLQHALRCTRVLGYPSSPKTPFAIVDFFPQIVWTLQISV